MCVKSGGKGTASREQRARMWNSHAAFTLIELLVVVAIVALFVGMIPMSLTSAKPKAERIKCVSNLKIIGLSFIGYAAEHGDLFPWESTNASGQIDREFRKDAYFYFLTVKNELSTPAQLTCPGDSRKRVEDWPHFSRANISYFISADAGHATPQSFLTGDRNVTTNGITLATGIHRIGADANVGWDNTMHKQQGNAILGDGSVQQLSVARFREQLKNSGLTNVTLAIP